MPPLRRHSPRPVAIVALLLTSVLFSTSLAVADDSNTSWNTFLGGDGQDQGYDIVRDSAGSIFIAGDSTATWGSPIRAHSGDCAAFVAKLSGSGELEWHTFLGGSGKEHAHGIAIDTSGNLYVTGDSNSSWGAPLSDYGRDSGAFVAKLSNSGELLWNTFLDGFGRDIAVDEAGNCLVVGYSGDWGDPIRPHDGVNNDAFVAKLGDDGGLVWNTFLGGGSTTSSVVYGYSIALDENADVYVSGLTYDTSWGSPVHEHSAGWDVFAAKLGTNGVLLWNTFLGGNGEETWNPAIVVDVDGSVYVSGDSDASWGEPIRDYTALSDGWVAKLTGNGALIWNTFLGGSGHDDATALLCSGEGGLIVVGVSNATWGSPFLAHTSPGDTASFIVLLNSLGMVESNTFIGGHQHALAVSVDANRCPYLTGLSYSSWGEPLRPHTRSSDAFGAFASPEMQVRGLYSDIANGDDTPSAADRTDFGNIDVDGETLMHAFTITNLGVLDLMLTDDPNVSVTGPHAEDFTVTGHPDDVIEPFSSTDIEITFDPTHTGVRSATISISSNDVGRNPYSFAIQGTGTSVLAVTGITAEDKLYDGTTTATLNVSGAALVGVMAGDDVTLNTTSAVGTFVDAEVGVDKTVDVSGLVLEGEDAEYYTFIPPTTTASILFPVELHPGWNMISIPVTPSNPSVLNVFPDVEAIYTWSAALKSYTVATTIDSGRGYWVAESSERVVGIKGNPVSEWSRTVLSGWNMIGSIYGSTTSIADPDDNPDGSIEGFAYTWDPTTKSYTYCTSIDPGKGYWIAATQDCSLTLGPPP